MSAVAPLVTAVEGASSPPYVVPLVHVQLPAAAVEYGFWGGLVLAAVAGAVDPALALLVGAGVAIARHRRR